MPKPVYLFSTSSHPKAINVNSLDIKFFKPDIDFSIYDYLIVTSKQTVQALKQYKKEEYLSKPALCVSKKSAKAYKDIDGEILDVGKGYGGSLTDIVRGYPKDKKWLYLRAEVVASDFVSDVKYDGYIVDEVVVYKSGCSQDILNIKIEKDSTLIFTSPSGVECFLKNHSISTDKKIIVIGKTTAKALPKGTRYIMPKEKSIEACINLDF